MIEWSKSGKGVMYLEDSEISFVPNGNPKCKESDCYAYDNAGECWKLEQKFLLSASRKLKERAIFRLQREIAEIGHRISELDT